MGPPVCSRGPRQITPVTRASSAPRLLPAAGRTLTRPSSMGCGAPWASGAAGQASSASAPSTAAAMSPRLAAMRGRPISTLQTSQPARRPAWPPPSATTPAPAATARTARAGAAQLRAKVHAARERAALRRQRRARDRQARHRIGLRGEQHGLAFLQRFKVRRPAQASYDKDVSELLDKWGISDLRAMPVARLDRGLAEHFDDLYLSGYQAEAGPRLPAAVCHRCPRLGRGGLDVLHEARAAMAGFRARARSQSRLPLAKPWVPGVIGLAIVERDFEFALALLLARDTWARLPSDFAALLTTSVVGPGRGPTRHWGFLLYPVEGGFLCKSAAARPTTRGRCSGTPAGRRGRTARWPCSGRRGPAGSACSASARAAPPRGSPAS
ncbi:unnamed protein product [Prorocentrum cordatum]|uniref:Uncharacterized protein n=1 Tax=Prorocentrum cordatum TaxID=2364126 RepID=A0ABN9R9Q9_9DINO|nr:unnamed protein product [Polarella glacialis]